MAKRELTITVEVEEDVAEHLEKWMPEEEKELFITYLAEYLRYREKNISEQYHEFFLALVGIKSYADFIPKLGSLNSEQIKYLEMIEKTAANLFSQLHQ